MRTVEDIKEQVKMPDILSRYGLKANRAGFIHCPFHNGDRQASLKVYDHGWYCFGCNANGDVFDFVARMEGFDFKEAFLALGGEYDHPTEDKSSGFKQKYQHYKWQKEKEARAKKEEAEARTKRLNFLLIDIYRDYLDHSEPFSDVWCDSFNALQKQILIHSELHGIPYSGEVIRLE